MTRVAIIDFDGKKPRRYVSKASAKMMVARGLAAFERRTVIRMNPIKLSHPLKSGQSKAYETSAIDKFPRFFAGGLTRNEHRPAPIPKFQAARVSH